MKKMEKPVLEIVPKPGEESVTARSTEGTKSAAFSEFKYVDGKFETVRHEQE